MRYRRPKGPKGPEDNPPKKKRKRKRNPPRETSIAALEAIKEKLPPARRAALEAMEKAGEPRTASELGAVTPAMGRAPWVRCSELVKMGQARECDKRKCSITGQTVLTYALVEVPSA